MDGRGPSMNAQTAELKSRETASE